MIQKLLYKEVIGQLNLTNYKLKGNTMRPILLMLLTTLSGCSGCLKQNTVKEVVDHIDVDMSLDWVSTDAQGNEHIISVFVLDDVEELFFGEPNEFEPEKE